jgi:hypothetical protein
MPIIKNQNNLKIEVKLIIQINSQRSNKFHLNKHHMIIKLITNQTINFKKNIFMNSKKKIKIKMK